MRYHVPACIVCRCEDHGDVKCELCDERVCVRSGRIYDNGYYCQRCWDAGQSIHPLLDEEEDRHYTKMKQLLDEWEKVAKEKGGE